MPSQTGAVILVRMRQEESIDIEPTRAILWQPIAKLLAQVGDFVIVRIVGRVPDLAVDQDIATALERDERHVAVADLEVIRLRSHQRAPEVYTICSVDGNALPLAQVARIAR